MKQPTKIFDRDNLKVSPELQDEIISRFNNYDLLIRVMKLTAANLQDMAASLKMNNPTDSADLIYLAKRLNDASTKEWQKDNILFY